MPKKKKKGSTPWVFTKARKEALEKARTKHSYLVKLGESIERKR